MFLTRKTNVKNYDETAKSRWQVTIKFDGEKVPSTRIDSARVSYIEEEVGYWRKANHIHNWFIRNCAGGDGSLKRSEAGIVVSREKLRLLRYVCERVIEGSKLVDGKIKIAESFDGVPTMVDGKTVENPQVAMELLPTCAGCFFGFTDYDQFYIEKTRLTIEIIDRALHYDGNDTFTYMANW